MRFNAITDFQNHSGAGFPIFVMVLLCIHLYRGAWSMCQSLGFGHARYTPELKTSPLWLAILIASGNCSISIGVMASLLAN